MSALLTSLLFAAVIGTWAYTKLARLTGGGNQQNAFIGAGAAGVLVFIFFFTLLKFVLHIG
jgi:hypothetical protein